jgi:hypothetical protein
MKPLRRLTALALAAVAALSLASAPASAASAAPPPWSYIHNSSLSAAGVGVIYEWDDGGALYDAVLPIDRRTDREFGWAQAEGYYVGSGYCADVGYQKDGTIYAYQLGVRGPVQGRTPRTSTTTDSDGVARFWIGIYPAPC